MTTYTDPTTFAIAHKKNVTVQLLQGLSDNPHALNEGATDAPIAAGVWHPYDMVNVGDGATGKVWDMAIDLAVASPITTPTFEAGYDYRIIGDAVGYNVQSTADTHAIELNQSVAGWAAVHTFNDGGTAARDDDRTSFVVELSAPVRSQRLHAFGLTYFYDSDASSVTDESFAGGGSAYNTSDQTITALRITNNVSRNWNAGSIYMYRRRSFT
jgi:hypothetical protein